MKRNHNSKRATTHELTTRDLARVTGGSIAKTTEPIATEIQHLQSDWND